MDSLYYSCFFFFGTIFGSFINVIIYRIPNGLSIIHPRSHCPNCKNQIPFYRNIPIFTYLIDLFTELVCKFLVGLIKSYFLSKY